MKNTYAIDLATNIIKEINRTNLSNGIINKYRKKPIVIEAIQFNDNLNDVCNFVGLNLDFEFSTNGGVYEIKIPTLEGIMTAIKGDYIIKGINGEFYPCKEEIFLKTYDLSNG